MIRDHSNALKDAGHVLSIGATVLLAELMCRFVELYDGRVVLLGSFDSQEDLEVLAEEIKE